MTGDRARPRRPGAAVIGMLLGAWCGLWLAGAFAASWFGWGLVQPGYLVAHILVEAIPLRWGWHVEPLSLFIAFLLLPVLAGALVGWLLEGVARVLRVDAQAHSLAAWRWTWIVVRRWWALPMACLLALFVLEWLDFQALGWFMLLLVVPMSSFFLCDRNLLAGDAADWRPRWRWPGIRVLGALLLLALVDWGLGFLVSGANGRVLEQAFPHPAWLVLPFLHAANLLLGLWFGAAGDGLWIDGSGERGTIPRILRKALDLERIGAYAAMGIRFGAVCFVFATPLLLCKALAVYEWPQLEAGLARPGEPLPVWLQCLRVVSGDGAMPLLLVALVVPGILLFRRLWVGLDRDLAT